MKRMLKDSEPFRLKFLVFDEFKPHVSPAHEQLLFRHVEIPSVQSCYLVNC